MPLKAVDHGVQGIVVSNHGGRQLDGAIAALDALPAVAEAVGKKITVLFDKWYPTGFGHSESISAWRTGSLARKALLLWAFSEWENKA